MGLARQDDRRLSSGVGLDEASVVEAYRRWARIYDTTFGAITGLGRRRAVAAVNGLPGREVLEVGVGTGLALPDYAATKRITGIDLSADMLAVAHRRVAERNLRNVATLREMNAEAMSFPEASFDVAVAMYVASVVPNPRKLLAELRRVVRPGGHILFINHFAASAGPRWWVERAMAPASRSLGWHPDFAVGDLLTAEEQAASSIQAVSLFGLFSLVHLPR